MATVFSYPDSRAVFDRCHAARVGVKAMSNLSKAVAMLDSNPRLRAMHELLNAQEKHETKTPPASLRDIVESIQSARGVTLYKESI